MMRSRRPSIAGLASCLALTAAAVADARPDPKLQGRAPEMGLMLSIVTGVGYERTAIYPYDGPSVSVPGTGWIMRRESYPTRRNGVEVSWAGSRDCPRSKGVVDGISKQTLVSDQPTIDGGAISVWRVSAGRTERADVDWDGETELSRFATEALLALRQCKWRPSLRLVNP